jgi:phage host-nuclease inhibitor protein Gam
MNVNKQNVPPDTYLDIAYFGMSNSIEDICKLNSDLESINLWQNGQNKTVNTATGEIK